MCGIAGIISTNTTLVQQNKLQQMTIALRHRGPDGEGFWLNEMNTVGLVHTRLSVIDLSNAAAQPMHYNNRFTIVFNGEIYNYLELKNDLQAKGYVFTTQSDTEVLLALWHCYNDACLQYLDGMFAFAIWDAESKEIFIARDRFGEKPLYYFFDGKQLLFASEMKALWAVGVAKEVNNNMLLNYLAAGFVSNPTKAEETFYTHIKKLPAAHALHFNTAEHNFYVYNYWELENTKPAFIFSEEKAIEIFLDKFDQSIERRLRSDVVVGTSLSGGLDSSSIVASIQLFQKQKEQLLQLQTFSAVFPGFAKDESRYIHLVNQQFNLKSHTVTPTAQDFIQDFDKLMYHQEEPFQSASIYAQFKVYELAKQHNVTVLLDGQGADEILGGYTKYYHWYWQQLVSSFKFSKLKKEQAATLANGHSVHWNSNNYAAAFLPSIAAKKLQQQLKNSVVNSTMLSQDFVQNYFDASAIKKPVIHELNDILYYNTFKNGLEDLLRYADRNSMAHSREVRLPFLSHELVEFVFSLPAHFKIKNGFTKHLLRAAMDNFLPKQIVWRKDKVGFEPPQQQWMQHAQIQEQLMEAKKNFVAKGIYNKAILNQKNNALAAHDANNFDWWILCSNNVFK